MISFLCLDFDGVILDSTKECIYVALEAYQELYDYKITNFSDKQLSRLKLLRPMVKGAGEYLKAIKIVIDEINVENILDFQEYTFHSKYLIKDIEKFKEIFYQKRSFLIKNDINSWCEKHEYYSEIIYFIKSLKKEYFKNNFSFISLKDKYSIEKLLEFKGLSDKPKILDFKDIKCKSEGLNKICSNHQIKKNNILFIDDNPIHLIECLNSGYKNIFMPSWNENCLRSIKDFPNLELISIKKLRYLFKDFL